MEKTSKQVKTDKIKELEEQIIVLAKENDRMKKLSYETPPEGTIVLIRQMDGNWKGFTTKFGHIISERQYDPQIVIQLLLTHG